jgi:hypothetical protein
MAFLEMSTSTQIDMLDGFESMEELTDQTFDDCSGRKCNQEHPKFESCKAPEYKLDENVVKVKGQGRGLAF